MTKLKYKVIEGTDSFWFERALNSFIENNEVHAVQYATRHTYFTALVEYTPVTPSDKTKNKDYNPYAHQ